MVKFEQTQSLEKHIKLSDLTARIQRNIDDSFGTHAFWVVADVTNHTFKASHNYHYLELVEKEPLSSRIVAKVAARAWGNGASRIMNFETLTGQKFTNNVHVLVQVVVQYSPAFGLQLNVIDVNTSFTLGQFEKQRLATLEMLVSQNPDFIQRVGGSYFTRNKSQLLNRVLQKLAVLSSDTSAGYQDFLHTLENNPWDYRFNIDPYFTSVQGEANAKEIIKKLIEIYRSGKAYDAVVLIRGGGSQTDFLIFDNYELNRAVAKFPIPIITGIGHQKNETICDLMAHTSLKTPTKVAEYILTNNRSFEDQLIQVQKSIIIKTQQTFQVHQHRLSMIKSYFVSDVLGLLHEVQSALSRLSGSIVAVPAILLQNKGRAITQLRRELAQNTADLLKKEEAKLLLNQTMVRLMNPDHIIRRGFALIKFDGKLVRNSETLLPGTEISIQRETEEVIAIVSSSIKK